ncbi:MAG: family 20 glycosylhydrolase [Acidobacteriota bacterium]|nr:family 20 glycosylhydrolase [Acidobacteriota bacterium]
MKRAVAGAALVWGVTLGAMAQGAPPQNHLMPQPAELRSTQGSLPLSASFQVATPVFHDDRLDRAIARTLTHLEATTAQPLRTEIGRGAAGATLRVEVQGAGDAVPSYGEDESYTLDVTATQAELAAKTVVGAIRGLATLEQLLERTPTGYAWPAVHIADEPRYHWRGLLIDCGRHFEPVPVIERTLDAMAAVKLNVFHWHLTEDQGFRIESKLYPKLTALGSDGEFYTQEQARAIVAYARDRGIRVVPEFDIPGHSRSWFVGYPELASGPGPYTIRRDFGIEDAAMDPTRESTYVFLDRFIGEMTTIFPDAYLHIGGDESNGKSWKANSQIVAFMKAHNLADTGALQAYFNQRVLKLLQKHNRQMVGWDEVLNPALPKDVVVQSWRGAQALTQSAQGGYRGILSQPYYLDGMKSAKEHYLADIVPPDSPLTAEQRQLILGGEICMWGEQLNQATIDSRIWPRAAAIAERFWSPATVNNVDDMYRRLAVVSLQLEQLGLTHLSHQEVALRGLAGSQDVRPLAFLASVTEPVSFGERYRQQHTSQLTPLTNFVDAIRPDPPSRHESNMLTHHYLAKPGVENPAYGALVSFYQRCLQQSPAVDEAVRAVPQLQGVQPRAEQLPVLAGIALAALQYTAHGTHAPAGWKQQSLATLQAAEAPAGIVRFTFLAPLRELVQAVAE